MPKGNRTNHKPNSGSFKSGADPKRNNAGQRNATAVAFSRELRSIIVEVGEQKVNVGGELKTRIELAVQGMYLKAAKGDASAFNALVERVEGKVTQPIGGDPEKPLAITATIIAAAAEDVKEWNRQMDAQEKSQGLHSIADTLPTTSAV